MKTRLVAIAALLSLAFAACDGHGVAPGVGADPGVFTAADQAKILEALQLSANEQGQVMNECGDLTTPQFLPAKLGGSAGNAILFAIGGGPSMAACYGDGPDLHLFMRDAAGWREIYSARGRMLVILSTTTGGVRDLADGGPGFTYPVWSWDGSRYIPAGRDISDAELATLEADYLP